MARYNNIDINPAALRHIASDIRSYTILQVRTLEDYLNVVTSQEDEITTAAYKEAIERVNTWKRQMEQLKEESDKFAQYLVDRAEKIESMESGR